MMASTTSNAQEKVSASTAAREAFFLEFAKAVRKSLPGVHLMVTGGFRSRLGLEQAIKSGACDLVGIGRPSVIDPQLPKTIVFNASIPDEDAKLHTKVFARSGLARFLGIKGLAGGTETVRKHQIPNVKPLHGANTICSYSSDMLARCTKWSRWPIYRAERLQCPI